MQKLRELNKDKHIYKVHMFWTFLEWLDFLELYPILINPSFLIFPIPLYHRLFSCSHFPKFQFTLFPFSQISLFLMSNFSNFLFYQSKVFPIVIFCDLCFSKSAFFQICIFSNFYFSKFSFFWISIISSFHSSKFSIFQISFSKFP